MPSRPAVSRMPSPTGTRAGERDRAHARVLDQRRADRRAAPDDHVQDARRQPRVVERAHDVQPGQRRVLRELQDDRVAVDQRRRQLPHRDRGREVPGRDQADHADRAVHGVDRPAGDRLLEQLADRAERLARRVAQDLRRPRRLHARLAQRLAHLARHVLRDRLGALVDQRGRGGRARAARLAIGPRDHAGRASSAACDGQVDVLARGARELADDLVRPRRVALLVRVSAGARAPLAGDVVRGCGQRVGHGGILRRSTTLQETRKKGEP